MAAGEVRDLFFPDPVLEETVIARQGPYIRRSGLICAHCHKEIMGRFHNYGPRFYDDYCWTLRFILEAQEIELDRHNELRKRMDIDKLKQV